MRPEGSEMVPEGFAKCVRRVREMRGNAADAARGGTRSQSRPPRLRARRPASVASPPSLVLACSRPSACARVGLAFVASPPSSVLASSPRAPRAPCLRAASLCASARAPALRGAAGATAYVGRVRSLPRPCVLGRRPLRALRPRVRRRRSLARPRVLALAACFGCAFRPWPRPPRSPAFREPSGRISRTPWANIQPSAFGLGADRPLFFNIYA